VGAITNALIILLLIPSLCYAGPGARRFMGAGNGTPMESFTINGLSSVTTSTSATTGSESIITGAGNVTVAASCTASGVAAAVFLIVDSVTPSVGQPGRLSCPGGSGTSSATLYVPVTVGSHTIEVSVVGNGGTATANTFRKPTP
jgi:hypothetical protein